MYAGLLEITENRQPGLLSFLVSEREAAMTRAIRFFHKLANRLVDKSYLRDRRHTRFHYKPRGFIFESLEPRLLLSADPTVELMVPLTPDAQDQALATQGSTVIVEGVPTWEEQGPRPLISAQLKASPNNAAAGAVQSIAVHPSNPRIIFLGTVNGGVWRTTNADPSNPSAIQWDPLTDQFGSLSIGSVAFDPMDTNGNTIYAGTGNFSNSPSGGPAIGVLKSRDGGNQWSLIGTNMAGRIKEVVPTTADADLVTPGVQQVILVATIEGGLFRSTDGGDSFNQVVGGATGLLPGPVTQLIANPNNAQRFYLAAPNQGVFRSDNAGASWTSVISGITNIPGSTELEITAHDAGNTTVLYAGVATGMALNGVFRSVDDGGTWTPLGIPTRGLRTAPENDGLNIVADPVADNIVYISGTQLNIFRFDPNNQNWVNIGVGKDDTQPHADSRDMVFLNATTLLESDDGGIYFLQNPTDHANNRWQTFSNNLGAIEFIRLAFDSKNDVILGGAWDNGGMVQGTPIPGMTNKFQVVPDSKTWVQYTSDDGQAHQVDSTSTDAGNGALHYSLRNTFGFFARIRIDQAGTFSLGEGQPGTSETRVTLNRAAGDPVGALSGLNAADQAAGITFIPFVLNSVDPRRMLIALNGVYEDADTDPANRLAGDVITDISANVGNLNGVAVALAYGGRREGTSQANVAFVGTSSGALFFRGESGPAFTNISDGGPGELQLPVVQDIVLDPEDWRRVYVISTSQVFMTDDVTDLTNNPFRDISGNLISGQGALTTQLIAVELFDNPAVAGDPIPLVGGAGGVFRRLGSTWSEYGMELPNPLVTDVLYSSTRDQLIAGTLGRGAWTISNASTTLPRPGVLQIVGDMDFAGEDDAIRLMREPGNPSLLDVFLNSGTPTLTAQLSTLQQINVNGLGGNDTLIMDSTNGLINVPLGTRYDGGSGRDGLQLLQTGGLPHTSDTYSVGPVLGSGISTIMDGTAGTQTVSFEDLSPVLDLVPTEELTVNATPADNAISYTVGSVAANGLVTIDEQESIEFSNKTALTLNAGAGIDTISLNNSNTPTGLTGITVDGGDPPSEDTLIVTGVGGAVTVATGPQTIGGATGEGGAVGITYAGIEALNLPAGIGDLTVTTTDADDTLTVTPGVTRTGVNSGRLQSNGVAPEISFANSGTLTANLEGGRDAVVVNGSVAADLMTVSGTAVTIRGRHTVRFTEVQALTVNGLAGSDTFNVTPSPTVAMFIDGGDPVGATPGDRLNILAGDNPVTRNRGPEPDEGSFIVGGNQAVSFDHIESVAVVDPNDQIAEAVQTALGSTVSGTISSSNDVDMFKFTVRRGQRVGFDVDRAAGSNFDSFIRLFNASGVQLASNNDGAAPGEGGSTSAYLEFTFSTAGTFYLGVSANPNRTYNPRTGAGDVAGGSTGGYRLTLTDRTRGTVSAAVASEELAG
jgi:hypothetical protein